MTGRPALLRSMLYIPASKPRAMEKARGLDCDAIIFDLEDAVAPGEKPAARATLAGELATGGFDGKLRLVRVNGEGTDWHSADLDAVRDMDCDAVLLPKVEQPDTVTRAHDATQKPVWAMIETPRGVLNALALADHAHLDGFVLGTNDLAKDLGARTGDRAAMQTAIQTTLLAARAAGIFCLDGVFNAFRDEDGLRAECAEGRSLGMDGKTLIHPDQIAAANEIFAPSDAEIDLAARQIEAYEASLARGEAVAVVDGRIVEALHIDTARATLAKAEAIRKRAA